MRKTNQPPKHIKLTSHPTGRSQSPSISWGAPSARERGPIVATLSDSKHRNAIGAHSGSYMLYRALAVAAGKLDPVHRADLTDTSPAESIGPFQQWHDAQKIVSMDPYGHLIGDVFAEELEQGVDIRPTVAVTKARVNMPEINQAISDGRLAADGTVLNERGDVRVTKAAIEPVWYLPGIAERFAVSPSALRRVLFEQSGNMFNELVTRPDLDVFLPPIGGVTVYLIGNVSKLHEPDTRIACRVHDECNGSDVFGSDICTCRPYLAHGIEECIKMAQSGGVGVIVYNRKEGRALGEVTKFLVYNARKRQTGGDRAETYFERTECVAGVEDMRFQELMPDVLHWLGIERIDRFMSMSNMKFDALARQGMDIRERVEIPKDLIPDDARVEMDAKRAAGYFSESVPEAQDLAHARGRGLHD
ncbi:MAG: GTP cyclohydrolase II [Gammaproteobacteria bacterium]